MTTRELADWAGFERVFGPITIQERTDVAAATISSTLANLLSKGRYDARDFIARWDDERVETPSEQTVDETIANLRALMRRGKRGRG